jgi:hypothetical protein
VADVVAPSAFTVHADGYAIAGERAGGRAEDRAKKQGGGYWWGPGENRPFP